MTTQREPRICDECEQPSTEWTASPFDGAVICDNCMQRAWERQQERDLESPPTTMQEAYEKAWAEKRRLRR